ncbi:hypothetical protein BH24ACT3_BH24ACT3_18350 [soil metagenome]
MGGSRSARERGADEALGQVLTEARRRRFLGPAPIADQIAHALGFLIGPSPRHGVDLGSGGGLPGLVLAAAWPDSAWTLVDASQRRTTFLAEAAEHLGLSPRVRVEWLRAEELGRLPPHRAAADLVVARSFGAPAVTAECASPLLEPGGRLLVSEPPGGDPSRWPFAGLAALRLEPGPLHRGRFTYQELHQVERCPERYPRRVGIPGRRPLF